MDMNYDQKLALGKILIIVIVISIGVGIMAYGIYFFTTDSWKPPISDPKPSFEIQNLGLVEINLHNDFGIIPGSYLDGDIRVDISVPNDTKVQVSLPGGLIPGESNYTSGLEPATQIPLNFISKSTKETNAFHNTISGLVYYQPGDFDAKLIVTKNNTSHEYTINDILSIQPYSYYESQRNNNITMAILYFTAGLVCISTSPVLVQLFGYISDFRKKNIWEIWIKENTIKYNKTKVFSSRRKIGIFFVGFGIVGIVYLMLWIGSRYQLSTTEFQVEVSTMSAIIAPLVYVTILFLLILSTSFPVFFKWIRDPGSRPIYMGLAGAAAAMGVCDLILIISNICLLPFYEHFGKCANR